MTHLQAISTGAFKNFPIINQCTAYARAHGDEQKVFRRIGTAKLQFSQGGGTGIIVQIKNFTWISILKPFFQRESIQFRNCRDLQGGGPVLTDQTRQPKSHLLYFREFGKVTAHDFNETLVKALACSL